MNTTTARPPRLVSLDAFRGFTIIGMLWVNNLAYTSHAPHQFAHAKWGVFPTFCDMIFPWFLLIVGVALPYAKASRLARGVSRPAYFAGAFRRAAMLMLLGWLIDSSVARKLSIGLGVLQLIGLAYLVAALLDDLPRRARIGIAAAFLVLHWVLLRFVPIPGIGAGVLEEGRNAIAWVNSQLAPYRLRGLLSVVPTAALVMIGAFVGDLLRDTATSPKRKTALLLGLGAVMAVAGLVWHLDLPMNKPLWTASYILFAGGMGCLVLAFFYHLIDVVGWKAWAFPMVVYGMNAIAAYVLSIFMRVHTVQEWNIRAANSDSVSMWSAMILWFEGRMGVPAGGMAFVALYIAFWWLVMYWMHRRQMYWRV